MDSSQREAMGGGYLLSCGLEIREGTCFKVSNNVFVIWGWKSWGLDRIKEGGQLLSSENLLSMGKSTSSQVRDSRKKQC
jgi:hypothetical protein